MALLIPDVGKQALLKAALGHTAQAAALKLKLYATNVTPADGDTWATYTEATGGGYADKTLTGSSWTVTAAEPSVASYAAQTFAFTGALDTNPTTYGYLVLNTTGNVLQWAERFSSSFTPVNDGDQIAITPRITLTHA